jgi:hypothetical protein
MRAQHQMHVVAVAGGQPFRLRRPVAPVPRMQQEMQPRSPVEQIRETQVAIALGRAPPPEGQQAAEAGPSLSVLG